MKDFKPTQKNTEILITLGLCKEQGFCDFKYKPTGLKMAYGALDSLIVEESFSKPVQKFYKNLGTMSPMNNLRTDTDLRLNISQILTETSWFFGPKFSEKEAVKFEHGPNGGKFNSVPGQDSYWNLRVSFSNEYKKITRTYTGILDFLGFFGGFCIIFLAIIKFPYSIYHDFN